MISNYHRPKTLEEALTLLKRPDPKTLPLGGGTLLSKPISDTIDVVDLQALGLNQILKSGNTLKIGATTNLQQLLENEDVPAAFKPALKLEAPLNIRNTATAAGTLVVSNGRSTFATVMLALDAKFILQPKDQELLFGNYLPLRESSLREKLITEIDIPLNVKLDFEFISRTPMDKPLLCVSLARWPSGRTRLVIGGFGKAPLLALDGSQSDNFELAAKNVLNESSDEWVSAEYRKDAVAILIKRCAAVLESN